MRVTQSGIKLEDGPILITGAGGFVARHLMRELNMGEGDFAADIMEDYPVPEGVVRTQWALPSKAPGELGEVRYIIHLAAMSSVSKSLLEVQKAYRTNLMGTVSLLEYMASGSPEARLLLISSSEVYESSDDLIHESSPIGPCNPYGTTKAAAEIAAWQFAGNYELDIVISRSFPHFGPWQQKNFALPSFCRRIIAARKEGKNVITAGNLNPVRDYLYISDVVRAYSCLLSRGLSGSTYNVCSGQGRSIGEMVEMLIRISRSDLRIEIDKDLFRPADISFQVGSPIKLQALLGWQQQFTLENGLTRLLEWWEERA